MSNKSLFDLGDYPVELSELLSAAALLISLATSYHASKIDRRNRRQNAIISEFDSTIRVPISDALQSLSDCCSRLSAVAKSSRNASDKASEAQELQKDQFYPSLDKLVSKLTFADRSAFAASCDWYSVLEPYEAELFGRIDHIANSNVTPIEVQSLQKIVRELDNSLSTKINSYLEDEIIGQSYLQRLRAFILGPSDRPWLR